MRRLVVVLVAVIIGGGIAYYVYNHGWKKPERFS